jgi:two-component system cell cycle sensor histidine kinase/response regulator CckA
MPKMKDEDLSNRVLAAHPETKVLFASAYTETAIVHQGVPYPALSLLQRPFTPTALALKVRELLDA